MPIIRIPNLLRPYVEGKTDVPVKGATVGQAMEDLVSQFPAFKPHLYKPDGSLRAYVNLILTSKNIKDLKGLDTPISTDDIISLIPAIAGG